MEPQLTPRQALLAQEGLASLLALAALGAAALLWPLEPVASQAPAAPAEAAAPWLFLGLQELLRRLPPVLAGLILPAAALLLLAGLPWLAGGEGPGLPTVHRPWRLAELPAWLVLAAWAGLTLAGALHH